MILDSVRARETPSGANLYGPLPTRFSEAMSVKLADPASCEQA